MSNNRIKDIVFSWDEALNFEGETGPYVQYAHARACSILRRAGAVDTASAKLELLTEPAEQGLVRELHLFKERVVQAMDKLEPSIISRYLIDLAQVFNRFYKECPILKADVNADVQAARLALTKATTVALTNGLALIGLDAPEKM